MELIRMIYRTAAALVVALTLTLAPAAVWAHDGPHGDEPGHDHVDLPTGIAEPEVDCVHRFRTLDTDPDAVEAAVDRADALVSQYGRAIRWCADTVELNVDDYPTGRDHSGWIRLLADLDVWENHARHIVITVDGAECGLGYGTSLATVHLGTGGCGDPGRTVLHELFHTLGLMQPDMPGSDPDDPAHHLSGWDVMAVGLCRARTPLIDPDYRDEVLGMVIFDDVEPEHLDVDGPACLGDLPDGWLPDGHPGHEPEPEPAPAVRVERVAGADRFETAVELSRREWPGGADVVLLAEGAATADALAGGASARGPLLLTLGDELPEVTRAELERLNPSEIVVLGGASVIDDAVLGELEQIVDAD